MCQTNRQRRFDVLTAIVTSIFALPLLPYGAFVLYAKNSKWLEDAEQEIERFNAFYFPAGWAIAAVVSLALFVLMDVHFRRRRAAMHVNVLHHPASRCRSAKPRKRTQHTARTANSRHHARH